MRFAVAILFLLLLLPSVATAQKLTFGFIDAPLSSTSLAVLKAAYAKLGIEVEGKALPAARALAQSDAGLTDGEVHRIKAIALDHPNLIRIDVPINRVEGMAVSCGTKLDTTVPENLRNIRTGIKVGNRYAEKLTLGWPNVTRLPDEKNLMELLTAGRLDMFIVDRAWATSQQIMTNNDCLVINEPPLVVIPLYHYLHKNQAALVPKITRILQDMEKSGELETVRKTTYEKFIRQEW